MSHNGGMNSPWLAVKAKLYAEAAVPEYWIVVLAERMVEVRDQPSDGEYRRMRIVRPGESISLVAFPEVVIAVSDFLHPETLKHLEELGVGAR